jgi:hypothetical protein
MREVELAEEVSTPGDTTSSTPREICTGFQMANALVLHTRQGMCLGRGATLRTWTEAKAMWRSHDLWSGDVGLTQENDIRTINERICGSSVVVAQGLEMYFHTKLRYILTTSFDMSTIVNLDLSAMQKLIRDLDMFRPVIIISR